MKWTDFQWHPTSEHSDGDAQGEAGSEAGHPVTREEAKMSSIFSWFSSPALQKIHEGLEEQQRIVEELKRYLEERLAPFQRHVGEYRRHIDHAMRHLENRLKPLRKYVQNETQNMDWMRTHLDSGLRDQFEAFDQFLSSQKGVLDQANRYIADQPRPLQGYLEDEQQALEMIYRDLEQKLDRFLQNLSEQEKILESLREPEVISEYDALAQYLEERLKAFERYVRLPDYRPAELFTQLEEAADRYKRSDDKRLFARVFEETHLADEKLQQALSARGIPPPKGAEDESRLDVTPDNGEAEG